MLCGRRHMIYLRSYPWIFGDRDEQSLFLRPLFGFSLSSSRSPGTLPVAPRISNIRRNCSVPIFDLGSSTVLADLENSASKPYLRPSSLASRVIGGTLLANQPLPPKTICSNNCSYTISIAAPSFSCNVGAQNTTALMYDPDGLPSNAKPPPYVAAGFSGSLPSAFIAENFVDGGKWDFEIMRTNYTTFNAIQPAMNVTCITWNSTYHLNYTFSGVSSSISVDQIVRQQPAIKLSPNVTEGTGGAFIPGSNLVHSRFYNATANYYGIVSTIYTYILGNATVYESGNSANLVYSPPRLAVMDLPLLNDEASDLQSGNITWSSNFTSNLEALMTNSVLSILTLDPTQMITTSCTFFDHLPHYNYNARRLWLIYGIGLGISLLCGLVGIILLVHGGPSTTGTAFSDFLVATRNLELDTLDLRKDKTTRLKYGPLAGDNGRYAFGRHGQTSFKLLERTNSDSEELSIEA
ncbi:hypothetical protein MIND_00622200 [Mycena indigotica]|uniref:Uncharacterized protein n=1 Tax=Mycena indigotica TaxID=2126181 RepID=A0A8H6W3T9_9AGAR|nr:uncharacterized protein MIND_00622200 [Mycena indigotica]KAF7303917.1 hypothetical protein MIND_00622200 [Mycena indigotica]